MAPTQNHAFFPVRAEMIGVARGRRVLLFDLRPHLREVPRPLPEPIAAFLESSTHLLRPGPPGAGAEG